MTRALLLLGCACSSSKPRTADDATRTPHAPVALDAPAIAIDAPPPAPPANPDAKTGDLQIRVEWKDVPIPMRASPGKTACHTPRAPVVAPTTTWGVPDVLLVVEGATLPTPPAAPRIVLADCALAPRIVAATTAVVESASDKPEKLAFAKRGELASLAKLEPGKPSAVRLPIAGHEVALPLDANGVYELTLDGETSWVVASTSAGVTEANGALLVRDLAPGAYPVTAWLPPRAGGQAKVAKGTVTVVAGDLAELTLTLE